MQIGPSQPEKDPTMNSKSLIAAAALAAASVASFAIDEQSQPAPVSTLTREEVRAEFDQLRAADALPTVNEASPSPLEANERDARAATLQSEESLPAENAIEPLRSEDELTGQATLPDASAEGSTEEGAPEHLMFVSPQGTVVIIESMPQTAPADGSLPFEHPAMPGDAR